jgi:hypothetical protein
MGEYLILFLFRGGGILIAGICMIMATLFAARKASVILAAVVSVFLIFVQSGCWALHEVAHGIGKATGGGGRGADNTWWVTICSIALVIVIAWLLFLLKVRLNRSNQGRSEINNGVKKVAEQAAASDR